MKGSRSWRPPFYLIALPVLLSTMPASAAQKVIIGFKGAPDAAAVERAGGVVTAKFTIISAVAATVPDAAVEKLANNPNVEYIEPDITVQAIGHEPGEIPWGINRIGAPTAWANSTGTGVKVAVLDTGIDAEHVDIKVAGGVNFVGTKNDGSTKPGAWDDKNGHGTFVAGVIRATHNGIGVVGAAFDCSIFAVKVLNNNGSGSLSDVIQGIDWAKKNGMRIANMSLGTSSFSQAFKDACDAAYANGAGVLLVAAAGNSGDGNCATTEVSYPAAFASVIAVGATDKNDAIASFSNSGDYLELVAPGVSITSLLPNNFLGTGSGTSFASPHAAGSAALVLAVKPTLTAGDVRSLLNATALNLGLDARCQGNGLVRADAAVAAALALP